MKLRSILFPIALFLFIYGNSQDRKCAANDVMERQIANDPSYAARMIAIEKQTQEFVVAKRAGINYKKPDNPGGGNGGGGNGGGGNPPSFSAVTIPVVVHILYNNSTQNIDQQRVTEQIEILNADFGATNSDIGSYVPSVYQSSVSTGAGMSFCLIQTIRKQTSVSSFSTNDAMKYNSSGGSDAVDPAHNLNIWVCNMSGGILGYAQFPGGNLSTDGVVILYSSFGITSGNYDLGRTATHEVGHYFNLRHIWGDRRCGDDLVNDTPLHDGANYGCPGQGATSNCKGPIIEMWMNYMDYTYDRCMYMFSKEQVYRMQATLVSGGSRFNMVQSNPCSSTRTSDEIITSASLFSTSGARVSNDFQLYPTLTGGNVYVKVNANATGTANLALYNEAGEMVTRKRIAVVEGTNSQEVNLGNLPNGFYIAWLSEGQNKYLRKLVIQH